MLYFFANQQRVLGGMIAKWGLEYCLGGNEVSMSTVEVMAGPGGKRGVIVTNAPPDSVNRLGYFPDEQHWQKRPAAMGQNAGELWVGAWKPDMASCHPDVYLAKPEQLPGHPTRLADGRLWVIPKVQAFVELDNTLAGHCVSLPRISRLNDEAKWEVADVQAKYQQLHEYAKRWWNIYAKSAVEGQESQSFDFDEAHEACVCALSHNYRVSAIEVSVLGLIDQPSRGRIMHAMIDHPTLVAMMEKKTKQPTTSAVSASGPGAED